MIVHATVRGGRFAIDEPAELPEGTTVELVVVEHSLEDSLQDMDPDERAALLASIDHGIAGFDRGEQGIPAEEVLRGLRER